MQEIRLGNLWVQEKMQVLCGNTVSKNITVWKKVQYLDHYSNKNVQINH